MSSKDRTRISEEEMEQVFDLPDLMPFDVVDSSALFPDLHRLPIDVFPLDWRWGDSSNPWQLVFLCGLARNGYTPIVEFGTFRGRTTYNLAMNCDGEITTIDIGADIGGSIDVIENIEKPGYGEYVPGELFLNAPESVRSRINLVLGDSTKLDLSHLYGECGLVIVDGGHSYEVCMSDSEKALQLVRSGGVIAWDDYDPCWPGVRKVTGEISSELRLCYLPREGLIIHIKD